MFCRIRVLAVGRFVPLKHLILAIVGDKILKTRWTMALIHFRNCYASLSVLKKASLASFHRGRSLTPEAVHFKPKSLPWEQSPFKFLLMFLCLLLRLHWPELLLHGAQWEAVFWKQLHMVTTDQICPWFCLVWDAMTTWGKNPTSDLVWNSCFILLLAYRAHCFSEIFFKDQCF